MQKTCTALLRSSCQFLLLQQHFTNLTRMSVGLSVFMFMYPHSRQLSTPLPKTALLVDEYALEKALRSGVGCGKSTKSANVDVWAWLDETTMQTHLLKSPRYRIWIYIRVYSVSHIMSYHKNAWDVYTSRRRHGAQRGRQAGEAAEMTLAGAAFASRVTCHACHYLATSHRVRSSWVRHVTSECYDVVVREDGHATFRDASTLQRCLLMRCVMEEKGQWNVDLCFGPSWFLGWPDIRRANGYQTISAFCSCVHVHGPLFRIHAYLSHGSSLDWWRWIAVRRGSMMWHHVASRQMVSYIRNK